MSPSPRLFPPQMKSGRRPNESSWATPTLEARRENVSYQPVHATCRCRKPHACADEHQAAPENARDCECGCEHGDLHRVHVHVHEHFLSRQVSMPTNRYRTTSRPRAVRPKWKPNQQEVCPSTQATAILRAQRPPNDPSPSVRQATTQHADAASPAARLPPDDPAPSRRAPPRRQVPLERR